MEERAYLLESGKTVLVAAHRIAVLDAEDEIISFRQMVNVSEVTRDGVTVLIAATGHPMLRIGTRSVGDAQDLEASVVYARALLPPAERHTSPSVPSVPRQGLGFSHPLTITGYACAVLAMIGSLGPWVTNAFVSVAGTDGDGVITLILGATAAVLLYSTAYTSGTVSQALRVLTVLAFLASVFVGGNMMNNVWTSEPDVIPISVGWGLWIVVLASIVGAGVVMVKPHTT